MRSRGKKQRRNKLHILNKANGQNKTERAQRREKTSSKHSDAMIKTPNITELSRAEESGNKQKMNCKLKAKKGRKREEGERERGRAKVK